MVRVLSICAISSLACATTTQVKPPLTGEQVEDLQRRIGSYTAQVEPLPNSGVPESLRLRNVKFTPEFVRGTADDGERFVPLRDVASLRWRSWRGGAALGLLVGPIVGAALGAGIGLSLPHSCGPQCNDSEKQSLNAIGGLLLGGVAGLFLGPVVGAFVGGDSHVDFAEMPRKPQPPAEPVAPNPNG